MPLFNILSMLLCGKYRPYFSLHLNLFCTPSREVSDQDSKKGAGKVVPELWYPKSQKQHSIIECYDMWLSLSRSLLFQLWTRPGRVVWERRVKWIGHGCKSHFYMIDGEPDAAFLLFFSALRRVPFNLSCMLAAEMWRRWYAPYHKQNQNQF